MFKRAIFKFRPSSHSEDYVLVATYSNKKDAVKAIRRLRARLRRLEKIERENPKKYPFLDWSPQEARFYREGNQVIFQIYTACSPDYVVRILEKGAEKVDVQRDRKALHISVKVPKGVTIETAPLLLEKDECAAIKLLLNEAGMPKIKRGKDFDVWEWRFISDFGYIASSNKLFRGKDFDIKLPDNWKIRRAGSSIKRTTRP